MFFFLLLVILVFMVFGTWTWGEKFLIYYAFFLVAVMTAFMLVYDNQSNKFQTMKEQAGTIQMHPYPTTPR
jgi:hypothetical protein